MHCTCVVVGVQVPMPAPPKLHWFDKHITDVVQGGGTAIDTIAATVIERLRAGYGVAAAR